MDDLEAALEAARALRESALREANDAYFAAKRAAARPPALATAFDAAPKRQAPPRSRPVHPNAGIAAAYRKKLDRLVAEMRASVTYWIKATWRANEPKMAMDATPAADLQRAFDELSKRWLRQFDEAAPELAAWFAKKSYRRSDDALKAILRKGGYSIKFRMTPAMRDVLRATVEANVQLIKSIPEKYLDQVQGAVMRSVQTGRDLGSLSAELEREYGVTKRRAAFISLDQNNRATSSMMKVRQLDLGIEKGVWLHSHGGKEPRPTHVANHGKTFSIADGWFDPDPKVRRRIMPGEIVRCRCVWKPLIKGFS